MNSALYRGEVRHRRLGPVRHAFRYRLFMLYLDLAELPELFDRYWLWSARGPAPAWFRRADYLGPTDVPLDQAVRDLVAARTGRRPSGPVRMLTHLRYWGYVLNPVTFYYCLDTAGAGIEAVVAEITNTPWSERHAYVIPASRAPGAGGPLGAVFPKRFHVSPFMPMDEAYHWAFSPPGRRLVVHMENHRQGAKRFDATLALRREPLTGTALAGALLRHPFMTATVAGGIYWQALRLRLKGAPFHAHPARSAAA